LGYPHHRPSHGFYALGYPLSGFGSLTECHPCVTASQSVTPRSRLPAPSEVPAPSASVSHEEPPTSGGSHPTGYVAPQGFSPSRRLAPLMTFRACFIPVPLMGFLPSEAFISAWCRTPSRVPRPPVVPTQYRKVQPGILTPKRSPAAGLGFSQVAAPHAPLGFSAPRFLTPDDQGHPPLHPLTRFGDSAAS
jgi:hypothetical protein